MHDSPSREDNLPDDLPDDLAIQLRLGLSVASIVNLLLFLNPYDPVPQELTRSLGLDVATVRQLRTTLTLPELIQALAHDPDPTCHYLLVARHALANPAIWGVVQATFATENSETKRQQCFESLDIVLLTAAAALDRACLPELPEQFRLPNLTIAGIFERLGDTVRPGVPLPPTEPAPARAGYLTVQEIPSLRLALHIVQHLPQISTHPFARALPRLERFQASRLLPLLLRFDQHPPDTDFDVFEAEMLVFYQAAQVGRMAYLADVTSQGTWEDWLLAQPNAPGEPGPHLATYSDDERRQVQETFFVWLHAFSEVTRDFFGPDDPELEQVEAEIRTLADLL